MTYRMCVSEKDKKLQVTASGENFDDIEELLDDSIREYFFIRLTVGDELSKRTKFALVTWIGNNCGPLKKGLIMHEKPKIRDCIQVNQYTCIKISSLKFCKHFPNCLECSSWTHIQWHFRLYPISYWGGNTKGGRCKLRSRMIFHCPIILHYS